MPSNDQAPYVQSAVGHRLYVDPVDERGQVLIGASGTLTPGSNRLWDAVLALHPWDVVVDVGANYGEMVLGAQMPAGARVICFEPHPGVLPFLRRSIAESGLPIEVREVALGAVEDEATFVLDTVWSGRSGLAGTHRTDAAHRLDMVSVPVRTLDSELRDVLDRAVDGASICIKVDVEGAEFDFLGGARDLTSSSRDWLVMVEILHMDAFEKAELAGDYTMRVMDTRTGELVVVPPASAQLVDELLASSWLHSQDAVLTRREVAA